MAYPKSATKKPTVPALTNHWPATDGLGAGTHVAPFHLKLWSCECQAPPSKTAGKASGPTCVSMAGHREASSPDFSSIRALVSPEGRRCSDSECDLGGGAGISLRSSIPEGYWMILDSGPTCQSRRG